MFEVPATFILCDHFLEQIDGIRFGHFLEAQFIC